MYTVRCARIEERSLLIELQKQASLENDGDKDVLLQNIDAFNVSIEQLQRGEVWVVSKRGTICGFSSVYRRDDGDFELDGLFVLPDFWKLGLGRMLIETTVDYVRSQQAEKLHVIGNMHAEGFYQKIGFVEKGMVRTEFGEGLLMEIQLA